MARTFKDIPYRVMEDRARSAGFLTRTSRTGHRTWTRDHTISIAVESGNDALLHDWLAWARAMGFRETVRRDVSNEPQTMFDSDESYIPYNHSLYSQDTADFLNSMDDADDPRAYALEPMRSLSRFRSVDIIDMVTSTDARSYDADGEDVDIDAYVDHLRDRRYSKGVWGFAAYSGHEDVYPSRTAVRDELRRAVVAHNSGVDEEEACDDSILYGNRPDVEWDF